MVENTVKNNQEQPVVSEREERREGVITVVLTADNHLGDTAFGQQPLKREKRQQRLRQAFQQATDFAIGQGVDLFIQLGDLFDTTIPDERDRSFVAERLAELKHAGVRTFALGGVHDTPSEVQATHRESVPPPQMSYARLGALHYFPPTLKGRELEPVIIDVHGTLVGLCGIGVVAGQEGDPLARVRVQSEIERAAIPILLVHAPIEGLTQGSSLLDTRAQVSRSNLTRLSAFKYIFAGYHHAHSRISIGQSEVVVAGATQYIDFSNPDRAPGFVFMGLAADGIRWCNHIPVNSWSLQHLVISTKDLWPEEDGAQAERTATEIILERLRPLCSADAMIQLRLEGELTRRQYHQLDLNQIRRYGEEHSFALAIDDSALALLPEQEAFSTLSIETGERLSPREELIALADEWIANTTDAQEKKALQTTKEELLFAMDDIKSKR